MESSIPELPIPSATTASEDRKSTRLNSSHLVISYAVFCLKKKKYNGRSQKLTSDRRPPHTVSRHVLVPDNARAERVRRRHARFALPPAGSTPMKPCKLLT